MGEKLMRIEKLRKLTKKIPFHSARFLVEGRKIFLDVTD